MARPVGRYFAPLIAKIQAYKADEKIVIDEDFKAQLRSNLLSKIEADEGTEQSGWIMPVINWRYVFGGLSALVLVVVVVVGVTKLPLLFKGQVSVLTNTPAQQVQSASNSTSQGQSMMSAEKVAPVTAPVPAPVTAPTPVPQPDLKKAEVLVPTNTMPLAPPAGESHAKSINQPAPISPTDKQDVAPGMMVPAMVVPPVVPAQTMVPTTMPDTTAPNLVQPLLNLFRPTAQLNGKTISSVKVLDQKATTVSLEIHFTDNTVGLYTFQYNDGVWRLVKSS